MTRNAPGLISRSSHPARNAVLLGTLVCVVLLAVGWFFILAPRLTEPTLLQAEAEGVELANITQQRKLADLTRMAEDAPLAAQRVQALLDRMPRQADLPDLFEQITQAALAAGIAPENISTITQSVPVPLDDPTLSAVGPLADALTSAQESRVDVAKLDLTVTVTAPEEQIIDFSRRIESLGRDVLISGLAVSNPSGMPDGERSATVTGTTFILESTLPDLVANVDQVLENAGISGR